MPKEGITLLRVLVSSTDDLGEDRRIVQGVVEELNQSNLADANLRLEAVTSGTHGAPDFGDDPQAVLNRQLAGCDIYIGILGCRFGTPTPRAGSGTEEEFNASYDRWKRDARSCRLMFYFNDAPMQPNRIDPEQLRKVQKFREALGSLGGLYFTYSDLTELPPLVRKHLVMALRDYGTTWGASRTPQLAGASDLLGRDPGDEAETPLDVAADAEEAVGAYLASFARISESLNRFRQDVDQRNHALEQLKASGALSPAKARHEARQFAYSLRTMAAHIDAELPLLRHSWAVFKDKQLLALAGWAIQSTEGVKELTRLMELCIETNQTLAEAAAKGTQFRSVLAWVGSLTRDLRAAARAAGVSVASLLGEMNQMAAQIEDIKGAIQAKLSHAGQHSQQTDV